MDGYTNRQNQPFFLKVISPKGNCKHSNKRDLAPENESGIFCVSYFFNRKGLFVDSYRILPDMSFDLYKDY